MSAPALPPADYKRPHLTLGAKLNACLLLLGLDPNEAIEWDHVPCIAQRPWDETTADFSPAFSDPRYLVPRQKAAHREKTAKVDAPANAKVARIAKSQLAHQRRLLVKDDGGVDEALAAIKRKRGWGKSRKLQSRGVRSKRA